MNQSFSFGFGSDDIEDSRDDMVEVAPSQDTPEKKPVAVTEPKLHKLQDLVWTVTLHSLMLASLSFLPHFPHTNVLSGRLVYCAIVCTASFTLCTVLEERRVQSPMFSVSMKSYCILTCSFSSMFCLLFDLDFRNCRLCNLTPTAFCPALENLLPHGPNSISRRHTQHTSARAF